MTREVILYSFSVVNAIDSLVWLGRNRRKGKKKQNLTSVLYIMHQ